MKKKIKGGIDYTQIRNVIRKTVCPKETAPGFPLERHLPCYNYAGPSTNLKARLARGDKPINNFDYYSMLHDIAYSSINNLIETGNPTVEEIEELIKQADANLINSAKNNPDKGSLFNELTSQLGQQIMEGKVLLEKYKLLDKKTFVKNKIGNGKKIKKPRKIFINL